MGTALQAEAWQQPPSELLRSLLAHPQPSIAIEDIIRLLGDRAFAAAILVFALPVLLPLPPGSPFILGVPLIFISAQLMLGRRTLWLPALVASRRVPLDRMRQALGKAADAMAWAEGFLKARHSLLCTRGAERLTGAACLILSVVLFLPIPLVSLLPAFALTVFALGLLRQDGMMIASGWLCCIVALSAAHLVVVALLEGASPFAHSLVG